jgi:lipopolysaccharide export system permease protein
MNSNNWNIFSLMDRYIFTELIAPFIFGMGLFTSLGVAIGTVFDLVRRVTESGLLFDVAIKILILKMPEFIVLAFPMSVLLAGLMAYSRLSSDSEIIALRSIGVNIYRLIIPAIILSLIVTGITFFFNDYVTPTANNQAKIILNEALNDNTNRFKQSNIIYPQYGDILLENGEKKYSLTRLFYAEEFDGTTMTGLTILDRSQPNLNQIIVAESATWNIADNKWDFYNGSIYLLAPNGSYRSIASFEQQQLDLPRTPIDVGKKCKDYNEMTINESYQCLDSLKDSGDERKIVKLQVRIQEKFALPFVCLIFGILGAALGISPQNRGKATSFGICVVVVFSYYLLAFLSSALGVGGVLSPSVSAWTPNLLGLLIGLFLLVKSAQ